MSMDGNEIQLGNVWSIAQMSLVDPSFDDVRAVAMALVICFVATRRLMPGVMATESAEPLFVRREVTVDDWTPRVVEHFLSLRPKLENLAAFILADSRVW